MSWPPGRPGWRRPSSTSGSGTILPPIPRPRMRSCSGRLAMPRPGWAAGALLAGLVIATLAVLVPAWHDARATTVAGARRAVGRPRRARWLRSGLDGWLLLGAGVIFYITTRDGYQLVLVPEGLPTL